MVFVLMALATRLTKLACLLFCSLSLSELSVLGGVSFCSGLFFNGHMLACQNVSLESKRFALGLL